MLWELSIVSSLSLYSILVQHACNGHPWLTSEQQQQQQRSIERIYQMAAKSRLETEEGSEKEKASRTSMLRESPN